MGWNDYRPDANAIAQEQARREKSQHTVAGTTYVRPIGKVTLVCWPREPKVLCEAASVEATGTKNVVMVRSEDNSQRWFVNTERYDFIEFTERGEE